MFERLEKFSMSKRAVTRLFAVASGLVIAGAVSGIAVAIWALANGAVEIGGPQPISINPAVVAGAIAGFALASLLAGAGTLAAFVSWAGALVNTSRLQDKTWFSALLVLGLVSFGWLAMIAYILRGPDGTSVAASGQPDAA